MCKVIVEGTSPYVVVSLRDSSKVACVTGRQHAQQAGEADLVYISQLPHQTDTKNDKNVVSDQTSLTLTAVMKCSDLSP